MFEYAWRQTVEDGNRLLSRDQRRAVFTRWTNIQTDDSFTALHFAVKWGNYTVLNYLVEKAGADLSIKNKFGSNLMHIAAQQD